MIKIITFPTYWAGCLTLMILYEVCFVSYGTCESISETMDSIAVTIFGKENWE